MAEPETIGVIYINRITPLFVYIVAGAGIRNGIFGNGVVDGPKIEVNH